MKHKSLLLLSFFLISVSSSYAQLNRTWWFFGNGTGLDFTDVNNGNTTVPTKITSGPIHTAEGCCAMSDYMGNLLIASDGRYVYNKNRELMENGTGLFGHESSSQSAVIVPRPSYSYQYYIITCPDYATGSGTANGINYSIIDLNQNGGLGKVIEKNIPLYTGDHLSSPPGNEYGRTNIYENIGAVQHQNGNDYWLVHRFRQYFYVWAITKDGITPDPVNVVNIGHDPGANMDLSPGNIKFSKDGRYIAHAGWAGLALGHFNTSTGDITGISYYAPGGRMGYSCEFSPSGEYLYYNKGWTTTGSARVSTSMALNAQTHVIYNSSCKGYGMQLGPDDKIYSFDQYTLWVIEDPDAGGTNVSFYPNFFTNSDLKYPPVSHLALNLPTFATPHILSIQNPSTICKNGPAEYQLYFTMPPTYTINHIEWDFGDNTVIDIALSSLQTPYHPVSHTYSTAGRYTQKLTLYKDAAKTEPITEWITTKEIKVSPCVIPVNPNVHIWR